MQVVVAELRALIGAGAPHDAPVAHKRPRSSLKLVAWVAKDDIDRGEWEAQARRLGPIGQRLLTAGRTGRTRSH